MYQSPIEAIYKDLELTFEKEVYKAVQEVEINVDKDELIKALRYDREQYDKGEWEMFELITSAYFGKQYYFLEDNVLVYSRESNKHMAKDEAIREFLGIIGE